MKQSFSDFARKFFEDRKELLEQIYALKDRRHLKNVFKRLQEDHDDINFYSWLSEIRVGLHLDKFCQELKYDCNFFRKKPDWQLNMSDQSIIVEVLRLNASEDETRKEINRSKEIRAFQESNPGVGFPIYGGGGVYNSEYFYGAQSKLDKKIDKYKHLLEQCKMPFILCITPDFNTKIDNLDTFDFLIGHSGNGYFKENEVFGRYTSGVLLNTYWGEWFYFNNEKAAFPLIQDNRRLLCSGA